MTKRQRHKETERGNGAQILKRILNDGKERQLLYRVPPTQTVRKPIKFWLTVQNQLQVSKQRSGDKKVGIKKEERNRKQTQAEEKSSNLDLKDLSKKAERLILATAVAFGKQKALWVLYLQERCNKKNF